METFYLVDFENVHNEGLENIDPNLPKILYTGSRRQLLEPLKTWDL